MKNELEQKSGKSWISSFIVSAIDQALQSRRPKGQETHSGHCINLTDMIIAPLLIENIPTETLEHLNLEFVPAKKEAEIAEKPNQDLQYIEKVLTDEFGYEVVRRLKLSLSQDKIRNIPPR